MTYLKEKLNEICRNFCPICDECDIERLCIKMQTIRNTIIEIMTDEIND